MPVNDVVVLYRNSIGGVSGVRTSWNTVNKLRNFRNQETILSVCVLHDQNNDGNPNRVYHDGHDLFYLAKAPNGLILRQYDAPGGGTGESAQEYWYEDGGPQQSGRQQMPDKLFVHVGGGMEVQLISYAYTAADYETLVDSAHDFDLTQCEVL